MIYYPGDIVEVKLNKNPNIKYIIVSKVHYSGGEFEYSLVHDYDINKPNAVMGPYKEDEIKLILQSHYSPKRFAKEFYHHDIVITSINHKRTIGKVIAIKTFFWDSRIQYLLDTSNKWYYASQLKECKGGI